MLLLIAFENDNSPWLVHYSRVFHNASITYSPVPIYHPAVLIVQSCKIPTFLLNIQVYFKSFLFILLCLLIVQALIFTNEILIVKDY